MIYIFTWTCRGLLADMEFQKEGRAQSTRQRSNSRPGSSGVGTQGSFSTGHKSENKTWCWQASFGNLLSMKLLSEKNVLVLGKTSMESHCCHWDFFEVLSLSLYMLILWETDVGGLRLASKELCWAYCSRGYHYIVHGYRHYSSSWKMNLAFVIISQILVVILLSRAIRCT